LTGTQQNVNFNTGVYFKDSISKYMSEVFIRDFNGYPGNGSTYYGFWIQNKPIVLNTDIHGFKIAATTVNITDFMFMNSIRFTYVLIDI
jgi:hypothetical protein